MSPLALYEFSLLIAIAQPGKDPAVETRQAAVARLAVVARAQTDSAEAFGDRWPGGARDLVRASTAKFYWSMGYRRDVQVGDKLGPAKEACLADLLPATLRQFARFETAGRSDDELRMLVTGLDYDSLRRCFDAGHAALVNARAHAARNCKSWPVEMATFAVYASGRYCVSPGRHWVEVKPYQTLLKLRGRTTTHFPDWVPPELTGAADERFAEGS